MRREYQKTPSEIEAQYLYENPRFTSTDSQRVPPTKRTSVPQQLRAGLIQTSALREEENDGPTISAQRAPRREENYGPSLPPPRDFRSLPRTTGNEEQLPPYPNVERERRLDPDVDAFRPVTRPPAVSQPDEINFKIMRTGLTRECRAAVAMLRPPDKRRFNGDLEKYDFETHLICFERAMRQEGITDEIRVSELPFWFTGLALQFIELYYQEEDSTEQYRLSITRLKQLYGNKANSVENMLDKILSGAEVKSGDQKAIGLFLVELEKFDLNATKTNRRKLLDSSDTINRVIRKRVPSMKGRWAREMNKRIMSWNGNDEEDRELKYRDFVKFIANTLSYAEQLRALNGKETEQKRPTNPVGQNRTINSMNTSSHLQAKSSSPSGEGVKAPQQKPVKNVIHAAGASFNRQPGAKPGGTFGKSPQQFNQRPVNNARGGGGGGAGGGTGGRGGYKNVGPPRNNVNAPPANRPGWSCMHCNGTFFHNVDTCNNFLQADIQRRYTMMRTGGHCYKCMGKNHKAQDCILDVVRCSKCNTNEHHTLLHPDNRNAQ